MQKLLFWKGNRSEIYSAKIPLMKKYYNNSYLQKAVVCYVAERRWSI